MNSRIYTGHVMHSRLEPVEHQFQYPLYFYAFDLSELESLGRETALFGYNRVRPVAVHDRDYLTRGQGTISAKLRELLGLHGVAESLQRVVLVTAARYFHHIFNPVSFYYCYDAREHLVCCAAEVNNTFREKHFYLLRNPQAAEGWRAVCRHPKEFHVSPFNNMLGEYEFRFSDVGEDLDIRIDLIRDGRTVIKTQLTGRSVPFSAKNLWRTVCRHPFAAALTVPRIVSQAARLHWRKKAPVYTKPYPSSAMTIRVAEPSRLQRFCMSVILRFFARIQRGRLEVTLPDGSVHRFGANGCGRSAAFRVRDYDFFRRTIKDGDVGFAESFMAGIWETDSLIDVLHLFMENNDHLDGNYGPLSGLGRFLNSARHRLRQNTPRGSRRNVGDHYDLGDEMFETFLDPTMTYSCALFLDPNNTLEEAQRNKIHRIIEKARISAGDHVLEIGSGWGSFAIQAARETGCRVAAITLSKKQQEFVQRRASEAGLADRVEVRLQDYREVEGQFDRIVSIEMLEAVGHRGFPAFFRALDRLLAPDGLAVVQVITIPDQRYDAYRRSCEFTQKHVFPGGLLPSLTVLSRAMTRNSTLFVEDLENIGPHYARTLREWRERFCAAADRLAALGFDAQFRRKWEYYFAYCEVGFERRFVNNLQLVLTRSENPNLSGNDRSPQ